MLKCSLCPENAPSYASVGLLTDHLLQSHMLKLADYLARFPQALDSVNLGTSPSAPPGDSADVDQERLRRQTDQYVEYYANKGLDREDPRLISSCYNLALVPLLQERISRFTTSQNVDDITRGLDLYRKVRSAAKEARDTISQLISQLRGTQEEQGVFDEFSRTMKEAEAYIDEHIGDFQFRCVGCGAWVSSDGIPVPYLTYHPDPANPGRRAAFLGNDETLFLLDLGILPLSVAALILRTSPEGLAFTSDRRGWPSLEWRSFLEHKRVVLEKLKSDFIATGVEALIPEDAQLRLGMLAAEETKLRDLRQRFEEFKEERGISAPLIEGAALVAINPGPDGRVGTVIAGDFTEDEDDAMIGYRMDEEEPS